MQEEFIIKIEAKGPPGCDKSSTIGAILNLLGEQFNVTELDHAVLPKAETTTLSLSPKA